VFQTNGSNDSSVTAWFSL